MGQTNNDCKFLISILTSSPRQQPSLAGRYRFKTEVCTCSQFPTDVMQWIKEKSWLIQLRSSSSARGVSMPNFEVLDARIASALNRIIHNSQFKKKISLEEQKAQKQDNFLRGRQIVFLICESTINSGSLEPMILSKTTPTHSLLFFEMMTCRNSILHGTEFCCP